MNKDKYEIDIEMIDDNKETITEEMRNQLLLSGDELEPLFN